MISKLEESGITLEISPKLLSIYNTGTIKANLAASEKLSGLSIYNAIDKIKIKKIRWNDVNVVLNNKNSCIIPYEFSDDENTVNKICSMLFDPKKDSIVVKEKIHGGLSFLHIMEKKLYSHLNDCFFPQKVIIKHKGNIFLNLISEFIDLYPIHIGYKVFIYLEENNFYIGIFESINCNKIDNEKKGKCCLILYNRFDFESYNKAVYYVLLILSTLKIDIYKNISLNTFSLPSFLSHFKEKDYTEKFNIPKNGTCKTNIHVFGDKNMNLNSFKDNFKKYVGIANQV